MAAFVKPETYFNASFSDVYSEIHFDLTLNEWCGIEQIAFLFSWIKNLKFAGKIVKLALPGRFQLSRYYSQKQLEEFEVKYQATNGRKFFDNPDSIKRRGRCGMFLMAVFGLIDQAGLHDTDFSNKPDPGVYSAEFDKIHKNCHKVIPFTAFDLAYGSQDLKFDLHFYEVIDNNFNADSRTAKIFALQKNVQDLLDHYACYSPFESKILSNIITQELYINALQHSFDGEALKDRLKECYITAFLSNRWSNPESPKFTASFLEEKNPESLDFYRDKKYILKEIKSFLIKNDTQGTNQRYANLARYNIFENRSYLDYSFIDLGMGIPDSLRKFFLDDMKSGKLEVGKQFSDGFKDAHEDAKIIEYALLMDTSKFPLDKSIEFYELVPRGLFFLVDMVRRYKGLLSIRSGFGKVIYDFSDKIYIERIGSRMDAVIKKTFRIRNAVRHSPPSTEYFPGTSIAITLPEKIKTKHEEANGHKKTKTRSDNQVISPIRAETDDLTDYAYQFHDSDFRLSDFPLERYQPHKFVYISMLMLYNEIIENLRNTVEVIHIKDVYNRLFIQVNKELEAQQGVNSIIFFDFAGLKSGSVLWIKVLYLLMNTPKVNEQTRVMIFNLPESEDQFIQDLKENLIHVDLQGERRRIPIPEPYLYKAIPCINFKIDEPEEKLIEWIGLRSKKDELLLTNLLLGKAAAVATPLEKFSAPENIAGHLIVNQQDWLQSTYIGFQDLTSLFFQTQREKVAKFLIKQVEGSDDQQSVYLSANGSYQYKYLSLYEILHDKYISRYFAKCLLNEYCIYAKNHLKAEQQPEEMNFSDIDSYRFTKILAVTVSSQLIGIAIRDLIEDDDSFTFLRKPDKRDGGPGSAPELIMLSSYYSFDTEKPFEQVNEGDNVLVVNDVISTGKLVKKIVKQVEDVKYANISAIFSVADTRIPESEILAPAIETHCHYFNVDKFKDRFFTLASWRDGLQLRKYNGPYQGTAKKKRINPLLNTVVELRAKHNESRKVLLHDISKLINNELLRNEHLKIGHFQQNLTHNGYMTDMRKLFSGRAGVNILRDLKKSLEETMTDNNWTTDAEEVKIRLLQMSEQLTEISRSVKELDKQKTLELAKSIANIRDNLPGTLTKDTQYTYQPDFIFYPVFSGIEMISHYKLSLIFGVHPDHIIGLSRFDTQKGWRFPFPAKRFNEITRNKSVLILDSGSLKGDSLVQLIDSIGFLDVRSITVLSVICRIEDFSREFYSRLKALKVKRLKPRQLVAEDGPHESHIEHVVPINIYFGINLHIPVYSSSVPCPFCEEIQMLNHLREQYRDYLTDHIKAYVKMRLYELQPQNVSGNHLRNMSYLPKTESGEVETDAITIMRHQLGLIDSYRFYPEYFSAIENVENMAEKHVAGDRSNISLDELERRELELILACILHEPTLLELIKNHLTNVEELLKAYLIDILFHKGQSYFVWDTYPLVKLCRILDKEALFNMNNFEQLLALQDNATLKLLHFIYWSILYVDGHHAADITKVDQLLRAFHDNYGKADRNSVVYNDSNWEFPRMLFNSLPILSIRNYKLLDRPFDNLSRFVYKGQTKGRHFELINSLNNLFLSVESIEPDILIIRKALQHVQSIVDRELRPSLEKITSEPNVRKYLGFMYDILGEAPDGILYHFNKLEQIYQKLVQLDQQGLEDNEPLLSEISGTCDKLVNSVLKEYEDKPSFFKISKEYPCEVQPVFNEFLMNYSEFIDLEISADDIPADLRINCHQMIFEEMLKEIIKNGTEIYHESFKIKQLTFTITTKRFHIYIEQNQPFHSSSRVGQGGRSGIIENFTRKFSGDFKDNSLESAASVVEGVLLPYHINLTFPVYLQQTLYPSQVEEQTLSLNFQDNNLS